MYFFYVNLTSKYGKTLREKKMTAQAGELQMVNNITNYYHASSIIFQWTDCRISESTYANLCDFVSA